MGCCVKMNSRGLVVTIAIALIVSCKAKSVRKRSIEAPEFKEPGNLSFKDCGRANQQAKEVEEQFPWLVRILVDDQLLKKNCWGVVISNDTVLTSAFCINNSDENQQYGAQRVVVYNQLQSKDAIISKEVITHDRYKIGDFMNNIALLKFDNNLLTSGVRPICLWNKKLQDDGSILENNGIATMVGNPRNVSGRFAVAKGDLKTDVAAECKRLTQSKNHKHFENGNICAKYIDSPSGACLGGFGAPLMLQIGGTWFLRGLYNAAFKAVDASLGCNKNHLFSFMDTARFVDFISKRANIELRNSPNVIFRGQFSFPGCGQRVRNDGVPLAINGRPTTATQVPWQVAIYHNSGDASSRSLEFICGGSLITKNFVLTAAHCVYRQKKPIPPNNLMIYLGKTRLDSEWTIDEGVQPKSVVKVIPHENYARTIGLGIISDDIALIELKGIAQFSLTVSTVCLWSGSDDESFIAGKTGVVAGWGYVNLKADTPNELQKLELPVWRKKECAAIRVPHHPSFFGQRLEFEHLCAGYVNKSTGPCNGDSGGALVINRNGVNFVRGIVSVSVTHESDKQICNPEYPALFTDVAKYRTWISTTVGHDLLDFDVSSPPQF